MTFSQIQTEVLDRLNLSSSTAQTRIGRAINRKYRLVTTAIGMELSRRATVQMTVTMGVSEVIWSNVEKIINVYNRSVTPYRRLEEVTLDELRMVQPFTATDSPTKYAISANTADTVTITLNCIPQTAFTLYADVHQAVADLSGSDQPAFPESFHDVLIEGVLADELRKMEKPQLAQIAQSEFQRILSDLKMWAAKTAFADIYQGKTSPDTSLRNALSAGSGGGSSSVPDGASSYTQTGLITFDRDPSAPFAVSSGSAKVSNLDADKLDGLDSTAFRAAATPIVESDITLSDLTTDDVSSTKHGFAPKSPADATKFLNGAATPAYAQVKDSDLSTSDITTNNVSSTKHGFAPKNPNDATKFLDGTGAYDTINAGTDITTGVLPTARGGTSVDIASAALPLGSGQISFPATQNASSGANVLDDYEEGSWTPVIGGSGGTSGQTYGNQNGYYVKIGKLVVAHFNVSLSAKGTITGTVQIQGLPFTVENLTNGHGVCAVRWANLATTWVWVGLQTTLSATTVDVVGAATASVTTTSLAAADIANNTQFLGTIMYRASA